MRASNGTTAQRSEDALVSIGFAHEVAHAFAVLNDSVSDTMQLIDKPFEELDAE